jgi:hydrogenase expression/formation protein HypD
MSDYTSKFDFSNNAAANNILKEIKASLSNIGRLVSFMEVCGTHTMAISKSGLRRMFPDKLKLLSGPGCPVCVTSAGDIDNIISLSSQRDTIITTFGDMLKVRGSEKSLEECRIDGADVRVVYSPMDSLKIAKDNPSKRIVFLGVGFETTTPTIAATVLEAKKSKIDNFLVYPLFKLVPPALELILTNPELKIDGFILPGHVSTIIGESPYKFVAKKHKIPGVITGFEPLDILYCVKLLLSQIEKNEPKIQNEYGRSVQPKGNEIAIKITDTVFEPEDAKWRAIGMIPKSGLGFREEFQHFDAKKHFKIKDVDLPEPKGCICGEVLIGKAIPPQCKVFGKRCTPSTPVGPCMVSSEGTCAAWYYYS